MLVKIHKYWVNPAHVVTVHEGYDSRTTVVRMTHEECNVEVPLPLDKVVVTLNSGDIDTNLDIACDALQSILEEVTLEGSKEPVDLDFIRSRALWGLRRLPV